MERKGKTLFITTSSFITFSRSIAFSLAQHLIHVYIVFRGTVVGTTTLATVSPLNIEGKRNEFPSSGCLAFSPINKTAREGEKV